GKFFCNSWKYSLTWSLERLSVFFRDGLLSLGFCLVVKFTNVAHPKFLSKCPAQRLEFIVSLSILH
ncbi:hypothetical protein, partial [Runella sp.]|uniref:hypothetical protein n=1 Tax=Runella sp. TaxID=1960881 RepID=UPI002604B5D1